MYSFYSSHHQSRMSTISPYFDHFRDFDWERWQDLPYRKAFTHKLMLRKQKLDWLKRSLPGAVLPHHFDLMHLAILHGLSESQTNQFQSAWVAQKQLLQEYLTDLKIESYHGRDWITIPTFDKCVACLIPDSPTCVRLTHLSTSEVLEGPFWKSSADDEPEEVFTPPAVTEIIVPPPPSIEHRSLSPVASWQIPECKKLEHIRLIQVIGHERGNYIGQVGPFEFKFGLTGSLGARTGQHTKDFDQFCLVWAQHCFDPTKAEALFKRDPRIMPRLVKKTTQKNRHREIIQIDATCTESSIKEIYNYYVQQVNDGERAKFTEKVDDTSEVEPPSRFEPSHSADYIAFERERLAFEKEKWKAEMELRQQELQLRRQESAAYDAATILTRLKSYQVPQDPPSPRRTNKVAQVSAVTNKVIRQFQSIPHAQKSCTKLRLDAKTLAAAINAGVAYRGYRWLRL